MFRGTSAFTSFISSPVPFFFFSLSLSSLGCDKPCGQLGNFQHHRQDSSARAAGASCQSARQQAALTGDRHTCQITAQQPLAVNYSAERRDMHSHRSEIRFYVVFFLSSFFFFFPFFFFFFFFLARCSGAGALRIAGCAPVRLKLYLQPERPQPSLCE